ncbi:Spc98 family-domain-containing protein [Tribonema minus]|uniref:Spc98 family-domain-containing protein n=1 Tax=Tribonema minus TaxID=303371 RepID=A0A835YR49_9STRA|nr:Spc98 family-domain-containing protein [Tribonema minus]
MYDVLLVMQGQPSAGHRDEAQTCAAIKRRLLASTSHGDGFAGSTDAALRFQDLVRRLRTLNVLQSRWSVLRLLESLAASPAEPPGARLPPPPVFLPPPGDVSLASRRSGGGGSGGGGGGGGSASWALGQQPFSSGGGGGSASWALGQQPFRLRAASRCAQRAAESAAVTTRAALQHRSGAMPTSPPRNGDDPPPPYAAAAAARDPLRGAAGGTSAQHGVLSDATERALLRDVLYALQGIDGQHVRYDPGSQAFAVDPSLSVSPATRDLVLRLCEMGWLFMHVTQYVEQTLAAGEAVGHVRLAFAQSLQDELTDYFRLLAVMEAQLGGAEGDQGGECLTLRRLALWSVDPMERLRLMATLIESVGTLQGGALASSCLHGHMAHRDPAGGALASCLHGHMAHGDPAVSAFVGRIMRRVSAPILGAIRSWVCQGELEGGGGRGAGHGGANDDFFVCCRSEVPEDGLWAERYYVPEDGLWAEPYYVPEDGLWAERYYVNPRALPNFIPASLADMVLVAGKAINFMRTCAAATSAAAAAGGGDGAGAVVMSSGGGWSAEDAAAASAAASRLEYGKAAALHDVVATCAQATNARALHLAAAPHEVVATCAEVTNARALHLVMVQHALPVHLRALKKFLLLGQGDFVTALLDTLGLDTLGVELGKRASTVYHHNLSGIVDSALRGGAVQYEAPEILDRVAVKLLDAGHNETGWDVFSLCYTVQAPLTAVIHASAMLQYRRMFHLLWRIKRVDWVQVAACGACGDASCGMRAGGGVSAAHTGRVEWVLAAAWRRHMSAAHAGVGGPGAPAALRAPMHTSALLRAQMTHFAANLSSYMMFEVLEGGWQALQGALGEARDLDSVIAAHNQYLAKILDKYLAKILDKYLAKNLDKYLAKILDKYLAKILDKALLGPSPAAKAMLLKLHEVLRSIIDYCAHQETMLIQALAEVAANREESANAARRTAAGGWGLEVGAERYLYPKGAGVQERTLAHLAETGRRYERAFSELLVMLETESVRSEILRHLVFRLDFNLYHSRRAAAQPPAPSHAKAGDVSRATHQLQPQFRAIANG